MSVPPGQTAIEVSGLTKHFTLKAGWLSFRRKPLVVKAVDGVTFRVGEGEVLGLVGESGCGKTTTGRLLVGLEVPTDGHIRILGRDLAELSSGELREMRRYLQMVFQDPFESLNPRLTVLQSVMEPLTNLRIGVTPEERLQAVVNALEDAGLRPATEFLQRYPHEMSGGQRQRVAIARALVAKPKVIVSDEPVSMLDVSIRAGVLNLMLELREKYDMSYVFITHDIGVARYISDRLAVMYLGKIVEIGETEKVIHEPLHPYTQALLSAVPVPDPEARHGRVKIEGEVPSPINLPLGCRFHPRCPVAFDRCGWDGQDLKARLDTAVDRRELPEFWEPLQQAQADGHRLFIPVSEENRGALLQALQAYIATRAAKEPVFAAVGSVGEAAEIPKGVPKPRAGTALLEIRCREAAEPEVVVSQGREIACLLYGAGAPAPRSQAPKASR